MTIRPTARELLRDWARRRMKECLAAGDLAGYVEWFARCMKYTGNLTAVGKADPHRATRPNRRASRMLKPE